MSLIFQLFNAMDLNELQDYELNLLKDKVSELLSDPEILAYVKPRADEVYEQLKGNMVGASSTPQGTGASPAVSVLSVFYNEQYLAKNKAASSPPKPHKRAEVLYGPNGLNGLGTKERKILEWAIECELMHSYPVLVAMQAKVQYFFSQLPSRAGRLPQAPDARYTHLEDPMRIRDFNVYP